MKIEKAIVYCQARSGRGPHNVTDLRIKPMKKFLILLFMICLVSCNDLEDKTKTVYKVADCSESVVVRKEPTVRSKVITELSPRQELFYVREAGDWYYVERCEGAEGGYVPARFIVPEEVIVTMSEILSQEYNQKLTPHLVEYYRMIAFKYLELFPIKKCSFWAIIIIAVIAALIASAAASMTAYRLWQRVLLLIACLPFVSWVSFSLYLNGLEISSFWLRLIAAAFVLVLAVIMTHAVYCVFSPFVRGSYLQAHLRSLALTVFASYLSVTFFQKCADLVCYVAIVVFAFYYIRYVWSQLRYMAPIRKWWQLIVDFFVFTLFGLIFNIYTGVMLVPLQVISSILIIQLVLVAIIVMAVTIGLDGILSMPMFGDISSGLVIVGHNYRLRLTEKSDGYFYDSYGNKFKKIDDDQYILVRELL